MTRFPGEKTAIQNKQATARLPHHEYNIDCKLSNLLKHFIMTVFPLLHVYSPILRSEQEFCTFLKLDSIILCNFMVDTALSEIKLPNIKSKFMKQ